jgi:hypothetical protein
MVIETEVTTDGTSRSGIVLDAFNNFRDADQSFGGLEQAVQGFFQ